MRRLSLVGTQCLRPLCTHTVRNYARRGTPHAMNFEFFEDMLDMDDFDELDPHPQYIPRRKSKKSKRRAYEDVFFEEEFLEEDNSHINNQHDMAVIEKVVQLISRDEHVIKVFGKIHADLVHSATYMEECSDHECSHDTHGEIKTYSFKFVGSRRMRKGRCVFTSQVLCEKSNNSALLSLSRIFVHHSSNPPYQVAKCIATLDKSENKIKNIEVIDVDVEIKY